MDKWFQLNWFDADAHPDESQPSTPVPQPEVPSEPNWRLFANPGPSHFSFQQRGGRVPQQAFRKQDEASRPEVPEVPLVAQKCVIFLV